MAGRAILALRASRLLVAASMPGLVAALVAAAAARPLLHARLVALYTLPVFIAGIAAAYAASSAPRSNAAVLYAPLASLALLPAAVAAAAGCCVLPLSLASLAFAAALATASRGLRGSLRLSVVGLSLAFASYALVVAAPYPRGLLWLLAAVYTVAFGSIYAVTVHSFPRTYGLEPRRLAAVAAYAANVAGALVLPRCPSLGVALLLVGVLLYPAAARLEVVPRWLLGAWRRRGVSAAARSHWYFLAGHAAVLASLPLVLVGWLLYLAWGDLVAAIHASTVGFVLLHIEIHAPMMVPVIYRMRHARRYCVVNYLTALAAAALLVAGLRGLPLLLVVSSLAATLYTAWPPPGR